MARGKVDLHKRSSHPSGGFRSWTEGDARVVAGGLRGLKLIRDERGGLCRHDDAGRAEA